MGRLELSENRALLWIGEDRRNPIKKDRRKDLVMDSVISYYRADDPKLPYQPGRLFLDNGAFTARTRGIDLHVERVISVQETLDPDLTIPLDYPFSPGMSVLQMEKMWNRTRDNILFWQSSTSLDGRLVPTLHAWSRSSLVGNTKWLQKYADAEVIALGSLVNPDFANFEGIFGDRQPRREIVDMISFALSSVEKGSDLKVHLMGWGSSPLMLHIGFYLGASSLDTTGYRRKAAYGKIILPGRGERYLGVTSSNFGTVRQKEGDLALLERCTCPVCRVNKYQLWADWKARAIHNEWVMKQEAKTAERFLAMGIEPYERYLDNVVFAHSSLKFLWEYTKLRKNYYRISELLFGEGV